ncbi:MAG: D-alanine transaminase [Oceanospirillaceae bacterium]|jgi:D-alanine transaminase
MHSKYVENNMELVYLNGQFMPAHQAKVSVFDRGFLFGDSVYEVIPYYNGEGFQLTEHLQRLKKSLTALSIHTNIDFSIICNQLVAKNGAGNRSVYLQVTRGAGDKRSHAISAHMQPTVFACSNKIVNNYHQSTETVLGIKVIVCKDLRWQRCDIKSTSLLPNILVIEQARQQGAQEALLMRDANVLEGASSNVFIVENQQLIAPPGSNAILSGTTSQLVKKLAFENAITLLAENVSYTRLVRAQEVWITSSTRGLLPVLQVDQHKIGDGNKGKMWEKFYQLLASHQQQLFDDYAD